MRLFWKSSKADSWNSVDVLTIDGQLQHARVVNVTDNGYVLDFDYPGHCSQFMDRRSLRNVFHYSLSTPTDAQDDDRLAVLERASRGDNNEQIQVLARPSADQPWTWFPAEFLSPGMFGRGCVVIRVQCETFIFEGCAPVEAVRIAPSKRVLEERAVSPTYFMAASYTLTQSYTEDGPMSAALWYMWKKHSDTYSVYPVCHIGRAVVCVHREDAREISSAYMECLLETARSDMEKLIHEGWRFSGSDWIRPKDEHDSVKTEQECDRTACLSALPVELLDEVFQSLDSVKLMLCRRVCMLWHWVLTREQYSKEIRVSFRPQSRTSGFQRERWAVTVAGSLWKCITHTTHRIVIRHPVQIPIDNNKDVADCLQFIQAIRKGVQPTPRRKLTVIFDRCVWMMFDHFHGDIRSVADACSDAASTVVVVLWKNCMFSSRCWHWWGLWDPWDKLISFALHNLESSDLRTDLYCVLEAALPTLPIDAASLTAWIQENAGQENSREGYRVRMILDMFQNGDRREGIHYRQSSWTDDELCSLDVARLTKLTLHTLQRFMVKNEL